MFKLLNLVKGEKELFFENELRFLCNIFKKCRVNVAFSNPDSVREKLFSDGFKNIFASFDEINLFSDFESEIKSFTIYKVDTPFRLSFIFFMLPDMLEPTVIIIGPYLKRGINSAAALEIGERFGVSPKNQKLLENYYAAVPIIEETSQIWVMLESFAEQIWGGPNGYSVTDILSAKENRYFVPKQSNNKNGDVMLSMKLMEERYALENELINAVANGQVHKAAQFSAGFTSSGVEKRLADPLRNLKNYSIIMNTILRKAAESGGVHPIYINDVSSEFASRIEKTTFVKDIQELMREMYVTYCQLVRTHSHKKYSSAVQRAMIFIHSDLSANLTLSTLADAQNISAGYLSAVFKKETGKTVTQYITEERIKQAKHLLTTTRLQVQTVALHCGIVDVQYFSKIFKKATGKTPKEYRETINN